jgi:hypothetical protein
MIALSLTFLVKQCCNIKPVVVQNLEVKFCVATDLWILQRQPCQGHHLTQCQERAIKRGNPLSSVHLTFSLSTTNEAMDQKPLTCLKLWVIFILKFLEIVWGTQFGINFDTFNVVKTAYRKYKLIVKFNGEKLIPMLTVKVKMWVEVLSHSYLDLETKWRDM